MANVIRVKSAASEVIGGLILSRTAMEIPASEILLGNHQTKVAFSNLVLHHFLNFSVKFYSRPLKVSFPKY